MIRKNLRWMAAMFLAANLAIVNPAALMADQGNSKKSGGPKTATPIKHLVIIFQENISFDHYFGTYPNATNPGGEPEFHAKPDTPSVNGLTPALLTHNPNSANPFRLDRSQALTCDLNHDYTPEQRAFDAGLMDKFPENTSPAGGCTSFPNLAGFGAGITMGYYDGNTVTALWNYAQHFAMSDNSFGTTFGPSTPGVLNLVSGQTAGADLIHSVDDSSNDLEADVLQLPGIATVIGDADPFYDDCAGNFDRTSLIGPNIGDRLNAKGITWGWFQGGFKPSSVSNGIATCATKTNRLDGVAVAAYSAHHNPFEYYAQSANPHHLPPSSTAMIGRTDQANHQYDLSDFFTAVSSGNFPAVSFLKANRAQDGHPNNSTPLDEQQFIVDTLNFLQSLEEWEDTAVLILWDDSDGWYDHQMSTIVNQSTSGADALTGPGACGNGANALGGFQGRCGYGPRLPFVVVSPFARKNFVDGSLTDQSSPIRFIEDNWGLARIGGGSFDSIAGPITNMFDFTHCRSARVFLNDLTGEVVRIEHEE
ncbi:MAG: alkaline phosphatase family protein [Candidatus Acidiferrales bacterium]